MDTTFGLFDLAFIFGLVIFIALAFFRGFVREFFSLINWIVSIFATIFLSDYVAMGLKTFISSHFVVNLSSFVLAFLVAFIISTIVTRKFGTVIREKVPFTTDQVLGVAYGFLKTFLVFGLIFSFAVNGHGVIFNKSGKKYKDSMPSWLYTSKFRSVISPFGNALDPVVKMILKKISPKFKVKDKKQEEKESSGFFDFFKSKPDEKGDEKDDEKSVKKKVKKLEPYTAFGKNLQKDSEKIENRGYNKKQIEKMDRLIEIVN